VDVWSVVNFVVEDVEVEKMVELAGRFVKMASK
jgi:hypothetical protein